jgi:hypothetical protein
MSHLSQETKRGMIVQWSDSDSSREEGDGEFTKHVSALTRVCKSDVGVDENDKMSYDDLAATYKDLLFRYE